MKRWRSSLAYALRYRILWLRDIVLSVGPIALLPFLLVWLAYDWLQPTPPKMVTLATGPAQSAYDRFGEHYKKALEKEGIEVRVIQTEGSNDNLQRLRRGEVDFAFVQGGNASDDRQEENKKLLSMGSLFVEPLWIFYRLPKSHQKNSTKNQIQNPTENQNNPENQNPDKDKDKTDNENNANHTNHPTQIYFNPSLKSITALPHLQGLRVNIGSEGSGTPQLIHQFLDANQVNSDNLTLSTLAQTPATVSFLAGELDVLILQSAPEAPMVQLLLRTPNIRLMSFIQNEAYVRRFPYLSAVTLPRGMIDLGTDFPRRDMPLLASTTSLLTRENSHPALQQLFAQAALKLHRASGWFNRAGEFPNVRHNEVPISAEAERVYRGESSFLQRYLPFWLANLLQRMGLALGLIIAFALPLSRVVPPLYEFRVRSRVFRWYGKLRQMEIRQISGESSREELLKELDEMEKEVAKIHLPLSYTNELYALRSHMRWVRAQLMAYPNAPPPIESLP